MSTLMAGSLVFGLSGALAVLMKRKIEELFCFSICGIIVILYLFGLLGFLEAGVIVAAAVCAAGLGMLVWLMARGRFREVWQRVFTPGAAAYGLVLVVFLIGYKNRPFVLYDDFSHWGLALKSLWTSSCFPQAVEGTPVIFLDYPPAGTLFSYFWLKIGGVFSEEGAYNASNVFLLCTLLPCLAGLNWKRWISAGLMLVLCFALPLVFNPLVYSGTMTDMLLGGLMVYGVMAYWRGRDDWRAVLTASLSLLVLTLVKTSGIGLALLALLLMAADELTGWQFKDGAQKRRSLQRIGLPALAAAIGFLSWKLYLSATGVASSSGGAGIRGLTDMLTHGAAAYQQAGFHLFWSKLIDPEASGMIFWIKLPIALLLVLYIAIAKYTSVRCLSGDEGKSYWRRHLAVAIGFVLYLFSVLATYFTSFPPAEAAALSSFSRYASTYLFSMYALLIFDSLHMMKRSGLAEIRNCALIAAAVLICTHPAHLLSTTVLAQRQLPDAQSLRAENSVIDGARFDTETDRLYYISQGSSGLDYYMERYDLLPLRLQEREAWWLSLEADEARVQHYTPEKWRQILAEGGFTYVYLKHVDEDFIRTYGNMFAAGAEIKDNTLYSINPSASGAMFFPVPV